MSEYRVTVYVNVDVDYSFQKLKPTDAIAEVDTFVFDQPGLEDVNQVANCMYALGNKEVGPDSAGKWYPRDVRSVSVGDLFKIVNGRDMTFLAVESLGFSEIPEPVNPIVPIEGTWATSRGAT